MRTVLRWVGCVLAWLVSLGVGALESCCIWVWLSRTAYIGQWGAAENPYAAEEAEIAGLFSLLGAVPTLLLLVLAIFLTRRLLRRRQSTSRNRDRKIDGLE